MPERRHRSALHQPNAVRLSAQRSKRDQGNSSRQPSRHANGVNNCSTAPRSPVSAPRGSTSTISPPGLRIARELVEHRLRIRNRGDDVLRHDHIEARVGKCEPLGIHQGQPFDIGEAAARRRAAAPCATSARRDRCRRCGSPANRRAAICRCRPRPRECGRRRARRRDDRRVPGALEDCAEHNVVERRPQGIGLLDHVPVEVGRHGATQCPDPYVFPVIVGPCAADDRLGSTRLAGIADR